MAAYAALVSLMRIIDKLHLHPHPPISLDEKQVESLTAKISFLQEFLEAYNPHLGYSDEADPLESRIADAAYAAEDVIESHIVDRITNESIMSSDGLYEGVEKVIQDMASIRKEAMDIRETMGLQYQLHTNSTPPDSLRSSSIVHNSSMVGVDDVLLQIKDNPTSHSRHLQIIPIVGMGGTEIWCMPQIRHVVCQYGGLPDPPSGGHIVLENLHTLVGVKDFKCSEEVAKRIPNLKKLGLIYGTLDGRSCLNNLVCLHKLVSLDCSFWSKMPLSGPDSVHNLNFPRSLKKLKLEIPSIECWEDILGKVGTLPLLEKLTLRYGCFEEDKWKTAEDQFQSLKYLEINNCNLKQWTMESSHFPRLEHLVLCQLYKLKEIPLEVAEIPTLGWIELRDCRESAAISARRIVEEQEESNGEATIQVRVFTWESNKAMESLASHHNIRVLY